MAYTAPPTKSTGNTFAAADWNTYVKDNMTALAQPPMAWVNKTTTQTLTTTTDTLVTWQNSNILNGWSLGSNILQPAVGGYYKATVTLEWTSNATSLRLIRFYLNGSILRTYYAPPVNGAATTHQATCLMPLTAGDQVKIQGQQNTGSNLDLTANCEAYIEWVSY